MTDRTIRVKLEADIANYRRAMQDASNATKGLGDEGRKTAGVGDMLKKGLALVGVGGGIAAVVGGFKAAAGAAVDFQSNLNELQGVSGASADQMKQVGSAAQALGNDTALVGQSAGTAALAMKELVKGGLSVEEAMSAAKGTLALATAAQIDGAQAATIQSAALNAFGLKADSAAKVADLLSNAANKSAGEIGDFGAALQQGGLVASQMGIDIQDTVTALAEFAQAGLKGSDAGTSLKSMLLALSSPTKQQTEALSALGVTVYDAQGKFVGLRSLSADLATAQKSLSQEAFNSAAGIAFGSDAVRAASVIAKNGAEGWDDYSSAMAETGSAAKLAAANTAGLPGAIEKVKNAADNLALTVGTALAPVLEGAAGFLQGFANAASGAIGWIQGLPAPVKALGIALGALALARVTGLLGLLRVGAGNLISPLRSATMQFGALREVAALTGARLPAVAAGLRLAGAAALGFGRSLMAAFGGPIGLAITGLVVGLTALSGSNDDAAAAAEANKQKLEELKGILNETTGAAEEAAKVQIGKDWVAQGVTDNLKALGLNTELALRAVTDGGPAMAAFNKQFTELGTAALTQSKTWTTFDEKFAKLGVSSSEVFAAIAGGEPTLTALSRRMGDMGPAFLNSARDWGGAWVAASTDVVGGAAKVAEAGKQVVEANKLVAGAVANSGKESGLTSGKFLNLSENSGLATAATRGMSEQFLSFSENSGRATAAVEGTGKAVHEATGFIERMSAAEFAKASNTRVMADLEDKHAAAIDRAKDAVEKAKDAYEAAKDALTPMAAAAEAAAGKQDALADATDRIVAKLDEMNGRVPTAEEAFRNLNEATDSFAKGFQDADGNIAKFDGALVNAAGHIDTTTEAGRKLYDGTNDVRDASIAAAKAAFDQAGGLTNSEAAQKAAGAAAQNAYTDYVNTTGAVLGNRDAAKDLGKEYGLLPKDIATAVTMDAEQAKTQADIVKAKKDALDGAQARLEIIAGGNAVSELDSVRSRMEEINGRRITYTIEGTYVTFGSPASRTGANQPAGAAGGYFGPSGWIPGYAGGGMPFKGAPIPAKGQDNLLALGSNGKPFKFRGDEFIVNPDGTKNNLSALSFINNGGKIPGFAAGGIPSASEFAGSAARQMGEREGNQASAKQALDQFVKDLKDVARNLAEARQQSHKDLIDAKNDAVATRAGGKEKVGSAQEDARRKRLEVEAKNLDKVQAAEKRLADAKGRSATTDAGRAAKVKAISDAEANLTKVREKNDRDWRKTVATGQRSVAKAVAEQDKANDAAAKKVASTQREYDANVKGAAGAKAKSDALAKEYANQKRNLTLLQQTGRRYDEITAKVEKNKDALKSAQSARASQISSLSGTYQGIGGGINGFAEQRNSGKSMVAGAKSSLAQVQAYGKNLATLRKSGLSADLLAQVGDGSEAGMSRAAVLAKDKGSIGELNKVYAQIAAASQKAATTVVGASTDKNIAKLTTLYEGSLKTQAELQKEVKSISSRISKGLQGVLNDLADDAERAGSSR